MHIKLVMRWRHAVIIPADSKETDCAKRRRGHGGEGPSPPVPVGLRRGAAALGDVLAVSKMPTVHLPRDPAAPILGVRPGEA